MFRDLSTLKLRDVSRNTSPPTLVGCCPAHFCFLVEGLVLWFTTGKFEQVSGDCLTVYHGFLSTDSTFFTHILGL